MALELVLTPHGLLTLRETGEALALEPEQGLRLEKAFAGGSGHGLLWLGTSEVGTALPPVLSYWRELGVRYVTALCALPGIGEGEAKPPVPIPGDGEFDAIAVAVPPMIGAEYLTADVLANLWRDMDAAFDAELAEARLSCRNTLKSRHAAWNLVGRVHFNSQRIGRTRTPRLRFLRLDRLSAAAQAQHLPLGKALQDTRCAKPRRLLSLLMPVSALLSIVHG
jgi:non-specific serine/threonine protein kinase